MPQIDTYSFHSAPKIFKQNCEIKWKQSADQIVNFIRGMSPYPAAWCKFNNEILKIFQASKTNLDHLNPGEFESDGTSYLHFGTKTSNLTVNSLQIQGKKRMTIEEFLRGYRMK